MNPGTSSRMSQPIEGRTGGSRPLSQPLSVSIPNSMTYRDARPPPLSPNDDENLSPTRSYYNPLTSPGSPEMPKAFFNYNYDRIQNDLLDEICDEIGIKDATDLDFMDFEPPGAEANFDPGPISDDMDNLDQLIMFGQIEDHGQGQAPARKDNWKSEGQGSGGECSSSVPSMPNNSPVYGRSPAKDSAQGQGYPCHVKETQGGNDLRSQGVEPGCSSPYHTQQGSPLVGSESNPPPADDLSAYSESQAIQAHLTDDLKMASPRKNSTESSSANSQYHDSMRKMAIAQDRMRAASVGSPASVDASSPATHVPPESPYSQQIPSPTTPGKPAPGGEKINQTDASKGQAGSFAAPETLPPGKERAMSRMKLTDSASGKRSPFDQGYFSVGSGGSHTEVEDLSGATPPQCPDALHTVEEHVFDLLTGGSEQSDQKPLTDDALLSMAQTKQGSETGGQDQKLGGQPSGAPLRIGNVKQEVQEQQFQPPRSPSMARREFHKAHVPRSSMANKPNMFQRQNSSNKTISFEPPPGSKPGVGPFTPPYPNPCPQEQGAVGDGPDAQPKLSASENCAPYPRSYRHESDMSYGSKRSASNPSSPKKQRRLTYNPYPENSSGYSGNNQGQYNMSGQSLNSSQYGGDNAMLPSAMGLSATGQMNNMPSRNNYGQPQQMASHVRPTQPYPSNQSHYSSQGGQYGNTDQSQSQMMGSQGYQQNQSQMMYRPPSAPGQQTAQVQQGHHSDPSQYPQNPPLSPTSRENIQYQQSSLGAMIAGHPDASKYGFMQQLISDRSNAFRSHPLFPLLRDLIVADMNFSTPSFPFQLIANLPTDFDKLLSNYFQRNPVQTKYEVNQSVENVVLDALRYAHKALIEKITERKRKAGVTEMPKTFSAIEDFCDRFDQAVKNTLSQNNTPKPSNVSLPQHSHPQGSMMSQHPPQQSLQPSLQQPPAQQQPQYPPPQSSYQHPQLSYHHHPHHHNPTPPPHHPTPPPHHPTPPPQQSHHHQQPHHQHMPQQQHLQHQMNHNNVQTHHMQPQQQSIPHHHAQAPISSHLPHPGMAPSPHSMSQPSPGLPTSHNQPNMMEPSSAVQVNSMQPGHQGMGGMQSNNPYGHQHQGNHGHSLSNNGCGPHGNMSSMSHQPPQLQQHMGRSMSPVGQYPAADHNPALQRQSSYPGQWPGGRNFAQGHASSLPSTPTKSGYHRSRFHQGNSASTINLTDVQDLSSGHLANQQKLGFATGSMPNFVSSSGIADRISNNTPPLIQSPRKMGMHSPTADIQRAGSEPTLNSMRCYPSPQRQQSYGGTENKNNNNNSSSNNGNGGTRKQVLPKEAVAIMLEWLREHRDNPYPNDDEKYMLIQQTKLTMAQINYWFTNARRRILPKWTLQRLMEEQARATGRELTPEEQKEIMSTKLTPQAVRNILEGNSMKKQISDVSYGHIMNSVINQS